MTFRPISISLLTVSLMLSVGTARAETAREFAQRVMTAIEHGDASVLDRAIDLEAIYDRASEGLDLPKGYKAGFLEEGSKSPGGVRALLHVGR